MNVDSIRARVVRGKGAASAGIGWWGGGYWSHFASVMDDKWCLDSRSDKIWDLETETWIPPGVELRPLSYMDSMEWMEIEIPCSIQQAQVWRNLGKGQLHKPYDKIGIWDFVNGSYRDRNWRDESAWFCSELGTWMVEGAGIIPELDTPIIKIKPGDCAIWAQVAGGVITKHHLGL